MIRGIFTKGIGPSACGGVALALLLTLGLLLGIGASAPRAQEISYFRIGTGPIGGTYFPVGGMIANAISNPPGSRPCERGGSCGVPGMIAVAQSTEGSVENIEAIAAGALESGLSQADVAHWTYGGTGMFAGSGPVENLRSIANLFPEAIHLVVRRGLPIRSVADLRGRRVSLDQEGSGTQIDGLLVLDAYGIGPDDLEIVEAAPDVAAEMLREGEIDAFFMVVGTPGELISELAEESLITLLPISGAQAEVLETLYPFFTPETIPFGTYFNVPETQTLSLGAQWLVSADVPEELIYEITKALWHDSHRELLDSGHPKGELIRLETALYGLGVPLHPGAERYYREIGLLNGESEETTTEDVQADSDESASSDETTKSE